MQLILEIIFIEILLCFQVFPVHLKPCHNYCFHVKQILFSNLKSFKTYYKYINKLLLNFLKL